MERLRNQAPKTSTPKRNEFLQSQSQILQKDPHSSLLGCVPTLAAETGLDGWQKYRRQYCSFCPVIRQIMSHPIDRTRFYCAFLLCLLTFLSVESSLTDVKKTLVGLKVSAPSQNLIHFDLSVRKCAQAHI